MKILSFLSILAFAGWLCPAPCLATVIGTSIVEQPVNLGPKSDPSRIPLGRVGVVSNHGYGAPLMIGAARPCPDGAMRWDGGSELDQNLASVFGISVETQDPTQITAFPVTLRVKPWKPPGYSPYTKEQVLAATLWCLIRSTGGTPENPLEVRIVAEGPDDKPLEAKYSGNYIGFPGRSGKEIPAVNVPGTVVEKDARGVAWVVFPDITRKEGFVPLTPGMIILEERGDGDEGWHLLPVWGNGNAASDHLRLNGWSTTMGYSSWRTKGVTEANSFLSQGGAGDFEVNHSETGDSVTIGAPQVSQETLAADVLALVISAQPTEPRRLTVAIRLEEYHLADYPAFRNAGGWKETRPDAHNVTLECEFVWDAVANRLTTGTVPLVQLDGLGWISLIRQPEATDSEAATALAVRTHIKTGILDGSLLAEKVMPPEMLKEPGLAREIAKAGYYEALATYSEGKTLPAESREDPVKLTDSQLFQAHHAGWTIGLGRGEAIAMEARKAVETGTRGKPE